MASLLSRVNDLITAIGADIKTLQNQVDNQYNASTAAQSGFAADTVLTGSLISVPQGKIKAGTKYKVKFNVVKTAAGLAAPAINVRIGTNGTGADSSRAAFTFAAQTAVIDEGEFEIECVFRQAGATATLAGMASLLHRLVTTGLNVTGVFTSVISTSGTTFDVTGASLKIVTTVNGGAAAAWTVQVVSAELINLTP